jgi:hypothetical protein
MDPSLVHVIDAVSGCEGTSFTIIDCKDSRYTISAIVEPHHSNAACQGNVPWPSAFPALCACRISGIHKSTADGGMRAVTGDQ